MLFRSLFIGIFILFSSLSNASGCVKAKEYLEKARNLSNTLSDLKIKETYYKEAIKLCPLSAQAHNNLGDVYEKQGNLDEAVEQYKKAIELAPGDPTPYFGIGDIFLKKDKLKDAKEWYEKGRQHEREGKPDEKPDELTVIRLAMIDDREKQGVIRAETIEGMLTVSRGTSEVISIPFGEGLIPFDFDKYDIRADAKPQLNEIGKALEKIFNKGNPLIEIVGHTDVRGTYEYNLDLSKKRAESVVDYLVKNFQISRKRLKAFGYGKRHPICVSKDTEECHAINRRVEIIRKLGME